MSRATTARTHPRPRTWAMKSLQCPKCGRKGSLFRAGQMYHSDGRGKNQGPTGVARYKCGGNEKRIAAGLGCGWHGTSPIGIRRVQDEGIDRGRVTTLYRKLRETRASGRYVITAAQNATGVWEPFWQSLMYYCKVNKAQLIVIPYRYKNPTSVWSSAAKDEDWWDDAVNPYILNKRIELHKSLVVMADVMTQPTAVSPLSDFETLTGAKSGIVGHPKLEMVAVPTPENRMPKILITTGACTRKNYIPGKAGKKGEHHHTFGATVVEVSKGKFHIRQINATKDGTFCDLVHEYGPGRREKAPIAGLVMGDLHERFVDPRVVRATFGKGGIVDVLKPRHLVWHDITDGHTFNHHTRRDVFQNLAKYRAGKHNIEDEIADTARFLERNTPDWATNVIVDSNHPGWLDRWVQETDPRSDLENCVFWAQTFKVMADGTKLTKRGTDKPDPFVYWLQQKMPAALAKRTVFPGPDEGFRILGIEVGYHGDKGSNGAKGTIRGFGKIGAKSVIGHRHTPGIKDGVYQVGTKSLLRLDYTHGPSSWMHTDCIIYRNGKRSLLNIIEGDWRG